MVYEGDILADPSLLPFDPDEVYAVIVSGEYWNPYGHALLNIGGEGGFYFHAATVRSRPKYLDEAGFQRYLQQTGKQVRRRSKIFLPSPAGAEARWRELMGQIWHWSLFDRNCARFVEEILWAGGAPVLLETNRLMPGLTAGIIRIALSTAIGIGMANFMAWLLLSGLLPESSTLLESSVLLLVGVLGAKLGYAFACVGQDFD